MLVFLNFLHSWIGAFLLFCFLNLSDANLLAITFLTYFHSYRCAFFRFTCWHSYSLTCLLSWPPPACMTSIVGISFWLCRVLTCTDCSSFFACFLSLLQVRILAICSSDPILSFCLHSWKYFCNLSACFLALFSARTLAIFLLLLHSCLLYHGRGKRSGHSGHGPTKVLDF